MQLSPRWAINETGTVPNHEEAVCGRCRRHRLIDRCLNFGFSSAESSPSLKYRMQPRWKASRFHGDVEDTSHLNGTPVQVANDYNNQYNHIQLPSSTSSIENPHDFRHRHNSAGCNVEKRDDAVCTPKRLWTRKNLSKSPLPGHRAERTHLFAVIINVCKQESHVISSVHFAPWSLISLKVRLRSRLRAIFIFAIT